MTKIIICLTVLFSVPTAKAATMKSIEGNKLIVSLSPNEMEGLKINKIYEFISEEGEVLALVKLEKIIRGKSIVARAIERSALLEADESFKIQPANDQDEDVTSTNSMSVTKNNRNPEQHVRANLDLRMNMGSHWYSGDHFYKHDVSSLTLRLNYEIPETKMLVGLHYLSDSRYEKDFDQILTIGGMSFQYARRFNNYRAFAGFDVGVGNYNVVTRVPEDTGEDRSDASQVGITVGLDYLWNYFYIGTEWLVAGATTVQQKSSSTNPGAPDKDLNLKSHGGTFSIGIRF